MRPVVSGRDEDRVRDRIERQRRRKSEREREGGSKREGGSQGEGVSQAEDGRELKGEREGGRGRRSTTLRDKSQSEVRSEIIIFEGSDIPNNDYRR